MDQATSREARRNGAGEVVNRRRRQRVRRSRMRLLAFVVAAAVVAPSTAHGQINQENFPEFSMSFDLRGVSVPSQDQLRDVTIDPQLWALVVQLADASFEAREQAMQHLLDAATDKMQLYAMLAG